MGDNITTDHIMPAGAQILPLRSNLPAISQYVFKNVWADFPREALSLKEKGLSVGVLGGENYGQGSSREHAALAPRYLGVRVKLARSFARIHRSNLINFGILPLTFENPQDYERLEGGDRFHIKNLKMNLSSGEKRFKIEIEGKGEIWAIGDFTERKGPVFLQDHF